MHQELTPTPRKEVEERVINHYEQYQKAHPNDLHSNRSVDYAIGITLIATFVAAFIGFVFLLVNTKFLFAAGLVLAWFTFVILLENATKKITIRSRTNKLLKEEKRKIQEIQSIQNDSERALRASLYLIEQRLEVTEQDRSIYSDLQDEAGKLRAQIAEIEAEKEAEKQAALEETKRMLNQEQDADARRLLASSAEARQIYQKVEADVSELE